MVKNDLIEKIGEITKAKDLEIANILYKEIATRTGLTEQYILLGCIYKLGKIQGIREEREKNRIFKYQKL